MINNIPVSLIIIMVLSILYWFVCSLIVAHRIIRLKVFREVSIADCALCIALAPATVVAEFAMCTYIELNNQFENNSNNSKAKFEAEK